MQRHMLKCDVIHIYNAHVQVPRTCSLLGCSWASFFRRHWVPWWRSAGRTWTGQRCISGWFCNLKQRKCGVREVIFNIHRSLKMIVTQEWTWNTRTYSYTATNSAYTTHEPLVCIFVRYVYMHGTTLWVGRQTLASSRKRSQGFIVTQSYRML